MLPLAGREPVLRQVRVPHVHDAGQRGAEPAPVVDQARQRGAAEVDAVVGALPRHEHRAFALALRAVEGERDLHRRVDRLGAAVDEEDAVEVARRELGDPLRELEGLRMPAQERRDEVELGQLAADGVGDFPATVAGSAAEQSGRGVDDPLAAFVPVVHALGPDDHPRLGLELAVGRERHPVLVEGNRPGGALVVQRQFGVAHRSLLGRVRPRRGCARAGHEGQSYTGAARARAARAPRRHPVAGSLRASPIVASGGAGRRIRQPVAARLDFNSPTGAQYPRSSQHSKET